MSVDRFAENLLENVTFPIYLNELFVRNCNGFILFIGGKYDINLLLVKMVRK